MTEKIKRDKIDTRPTRPADLKVDYSFWFSSNIKDWYTVSKTKKDKKNDWGLK